MQTNQFLSNEKNHSLSLVDNSNQQINQAKNEAKEEKKNNPKSTEKGYKEPLIPRSKTKDRLEIW